MPPSDLTEDESDAESTLSLNSEAFRKLCKILPDIQEVDLDEISQVCTEFGYLGDLGF